MHPLLRNMLISALLLGGFAVVGTTVVTWTHQNTAPRIEENQRAALLRTLHTLVPPTEHDNDLYEDRILIEAPALGRGPLPVYRARQDGAPVAAILTAVAPDGYSGDIRLLVTVRYDGTLSSVRVVAHDETPGLGDYIEEQRSDWIHQFADKSLGDPPAAQWQVRSDGGAFDQVTGATITARAVVRAVRRTLEYFQAHREELFATRATTVETGT